MYRPWLLSSPSGFINWYNYTMVAYCWECQQALCRETYFRIGLPFTTGPIWLVKTFIRCDTFSFLKFSMDMWHENSFIDGCKFFYLLGSVDHSSKVITASDFQYIFPDVKPWLMQVHMMIYCNKCDLRLTFMPNYSCYFNSFLFCVTELTVLYHYWPP